MSKNPPHYFSLEILMRGGDGRHVTPTQHKQWAMRDSNPHSRDYESPALTIKLIALTNE